MPDETIFNAGPFEIELLKNRMIYKAPLAEINIFYVIFHNDLADRQITLL